MLCRWLSTLTPFYFILFLIFIYFWDRERQSMNRGGSEREGDTESEAGSRLRAVSTEPDAGLELTNHAIMTWAKVGHLTDLPRRLRSLRHLRRISCNLGWPILSGLGALAFKILSNRNVSHNGHCNSRLFLVRLCHCKYLQLLGPQFLDTR